MKKYYIVWEDFANAYKLYWVTDKGYYPNAESYPCKFDTADFLSNYPDAERITRKKAIAYARAERQRRKLNPSFAGYADEYIFPYGAAWCDTTYAYLHTDSTGIIVK